MLLATLGLPDTFFVGIAGSFAFGLMGILMMLLGFKLFEWVTPRLHVEEELGKGNMSVAVVVGAFFLAIAYVVGHVVH